MTDSDQLLKCPTGIKVFDQITEGGLPKNRTTLVYGGAGSAGTLFGIDFLINGAQAAGWIDFVLPPNKMSNELHKLAKDFQNKKA